MLTALFTLALVANAQTPNTAQSPNKDPRIPQLLEALGKVRSISQTAISPDGRHLAWVVRAKSGSEIMLGGPEGQDPHPVLTQDRSCDRRCSSPRALPLPGFSPLRTDRSHHIGHTRTCHQVSKH